MIDPANRGDIYKYPWSLGVSPRQPDLQDLLEFMKFQGYGIFGKGAQRDLPPTTLFAANRFWVTKSLARPAGILTLDVVDIGPAAPNQRILFSRNHCAEAKAMQVDIIRDQVVGEYELYGRTSTEYSI